MASQSTGGSSMQLLRTAATPMICLLTLVVVILSIILWRRSRPPKSAVSVSVGQKAVFTPPVGQKSLAERLRELDEREEQHRVTTVTEIKKYDKYEYDPTSCASLEHFQPVKKQTHCVFSPSSKIWGSHDYDTTVSIEENIKRSLPAFMRLIEEVQTKPIDGFLFEIPMQPKTVEEFAWIVTRVLRVISEHDPAYSRFMENEHIGRRGWYPQVNRQPFFVTTFAPCYPTNHSRFSFGVNSCFVLFQPDISFSRHSIEDNHPDDDKYNTVRQRIRQIFKANNRAYYIPASRFAPLAEHVVASMNIDERFHWWEVKDPAIAPICPDSPPDLPRLPTVITTSDMKTSISEG